MSTLNAAVIVAIVTSFPCFAQIADTPSYSEPDAVSTGTAPPQEPASTSSIEDSRDRIYYPGDTEHLKPLGRKLLFNVLLDQKEIWTSPFHMRRKDIKWWVGFGALTAALIATDHKTINTFENSKGQISWGNNLSRIGTSYTLIPLVAGFYGYGVLRDDPKPREVGVLGAEALLDSLIVVEVLKPIGRRVRPDSSGERGQFFDGGSSFPSGHAIASWSLASLIAHEYGQGHTKLIPIVAYGLASVVSTARFAAQKHFASDIVAGGAMGWFIGRYVYQTHMDHAIHQHAWLHPKIVPQFQPADRYYGLALQFAN